MSEPRISVVLLTVNGGWNVRKVLRHLAADCSAGSLEVILVHPVEQKLRIEPPVGFAGFRTLALENFKSLGFARAAAAQAASAPAVLFAEDHAFPSNGSIDVLLGRLQEGFAGAGPEMRTANPRTTVSWADAMACYGEFFEPALDERAQRLPWHNSAYQRGVLLEFGEELPFLLEADSSLQSAIIDRGYRMIMEPRASTWHCNISLLPSHLRGLYWGNRLFGSARSERERWNWPRRLIYCACWPLIVGLRLKRFWTNCLRLRQPGVPNYFVLPMLVVSAMVAATGEVCGYFRGSGPTLERRLFFELNRDLHVVPGDIAIVQDES